MASPAKRAPDDDADDRCVIASRSGVARQAGSAAGLYVGYRFLDPPHVRARTAMIAGAIVIFVSVLITVRIVMIAAMIVDDHLSLGTFMIIIIIIMINVLLTTKEAIEALNASW